MGFAEDKFVSAVEDNRKCAFCKGVFDNPVQTQCCQRIFCSKCVLSSESVTQKGRCPAEGCGQELTSADLKTAQDLRQAIANMQVKCEHEGCTDTTSLADLPGHLDNCDYRPVTCRNHGCKTKLPYLHVSRHETHECDYRPVGVCDEGCGLVLLQCDLKHHRCLEALRSHSSQQELLISALQADVNELTKKFYQREKTLLTQLAKLHTQVQVQTLQFQKKVADYMSQIQYLCLRLAQEKNQNYEETMLTINLQREGGTLGFNIMGGYSSNSGLSEGVIVSKIGEGTEANKKGMKLHDKILKVSLEAGQHEVRSPDSVRSVGAMSISSCSSPDYSPISPSDHSFSKQVNGQDLSKSSHEEAVEAFRTASEPIVVEVLRRVTKNTSNKMKTRSPPPLPSPEMVTVATQTDDFIESSYFDLFHCPPSPSSGLFTHDHHVASQMGLTELDVPPDLYDDDFDPERAFDMEYEEVTLHRQSSDQKVGLTLCYGSADDDITDIFVGEIDPYSIAADDGRIREGDQILQISGVDVHSREQAIQLFAENRSDITLLLARQVVQMDDGFMDERHALDDLHNLEGLNQPHHHGKLELTAAMLGQGGVGRRLHDLEEGGTTDTATTENSHKHEKDSGVGRTDGDSTRNDESSEQEMTENDPISSAIAAKYNGLVGCTDLHYSNDSFTSNETSHGDHDLSVNDIPAEECRKFREVLETRCSSKASDASSSRPSVARKDSHSSIEQEIAALNQEMEQIQLECQEIVELHTREQHKVHKQGDTLRNTDPSFRSPRMVPRMGTRLDYIKQLAQSTGTGGNEGEPVWIRHEQLARIANQAHVESITAADLNRNTKFVNVTDSAKDASNTSAYNTGESSRSTPLTLELHTHASCDNDSKAQNNSMLCLAAPMSRPPHSGSEKTLVQADNQTSRKEWSSDGDSRSRATVTKSHSSTSVSRMSQTGELDNKDVQEPDSLQALYSQYADVMYTNRANLQHTIMVQQKLFQQQLMARARAKKLPSPEYHHYETIGSPTRESSHSNSSSKSRASKSPQSKSPQGGSPGHPKKPSSASSSPSRPADTLRDSADPGTASGKNSSRPDMEWVVKRRADGSRYITRRPAKHKLLKERARKLQEERCGLTTDDDAVSELKVGRYWNKEERKRHLEKSRDRKMKKEAMLKERMETVKEHEEHREPNIVELSHRKMMKHKGKKVLDDFTTLTEVLAHGSRDPQPKPYNPLLSVTTV